MEALSRAVSKPQAKPYRSRQLKHDGEIHLDKNGLLTWSPDDIENPKNWSRARRWYISITCIMMTMNAAMASSSPSGCLPSIEEELHVSAEVAKLTVTLFVLGFCAGPCLWAPLSEYYGRRIVFYLCFISYFAFTFLCAFTPNIAGLLVARFLCGAFVAGCVSNTPGIFVDLWGPIERGNCMTLFTCALSMGPAIGPITSGFYQLKLDWRWNFYQLLWTGGFAILFLPTLPETLPSRALLGKAKRIRRAKIPGYENVRAPCEVHEQSLMTNFKIALLRPWRILVDPIASFLAVYMIVVYTLLYMLFTLFPIIFIEIRGWNAGVGELPLLSVAVGCVIAGLYTYWDSQRQRKRIAQGHQQAPEDTLPISMAGAVAFPIGIFWLCWTGAYASVHWILPCIGGVIVSFAIVLFFVAFLSYLSETYLMYAASAQAGNQLARSAIAATAPLFAEQMFSKLGVGGGGSLIGGVGVLLMPIPFVLYKYGRAIRIKSAFAPTSENPPPKGKRADVVPVESSSESKEEEEEEEKREAIERTLTDGDSQRSKSREDDGIDVERQAGL